MESFNPSMEPEASDKLIRRVNVGITSSKHCFNRKAGMWSFLDALIGFECIILLRSAELMGRNSENVAPWK